MPDLSLTSIAALFNAAIFLGLIVQVIRIRRHDDQVPDEIADRPLSRALHGQASAAEQIPLALVLGLLVELQGGPEGPLASALAAFTLGRLLHGIHFGWHGIPSQLRFYGMFLTLVGQVTLAALLFWTVFWM